MFYNYSIPIPEGKIVFQKRDCGTYVLWEYDRIYLPDKKYNIPKRTVIGKMCENNTSMMYPNSNYNRNFSEKEISTATKQTIVEFTETELFLIEMAIDEVLWKLAPNSPNYTKYDLLNQKVRGRRLAMFKKDNLV